MLDFAKFLLFIRLRVDRIRFFKASFPHPSSIHLPLSEIPLQSQGHQRPEMGISFSRRRTNSYLQNQPPPPLPRPHPPHLVSSSYFYAASDPPHLPPPSTLPLPQPQNYVFAANAPYTPSPYPPPNTCNFYPTHNPPPTPSYYSQPQPQPQPPPYASSFNYANPNPMMIRPNYHPQHQFNQSNGWPAVLPSLPPPPYVEHQNAKKVRNDVNVHKGTLRLEVDRHNPDHHLVSFVFDALFDGR